MGIGSDSAWRASSLHVANGALLVGLLLHGIQNWGKLPARVPVHFGFSGVPDRFADKGLEVAFILFGLPLLLMALLYGCLWFVNVAFRTPSLLNSWTRRVWEQTPRNRRHEIVAHTRETLSLTILATLALLWSVNTGLVAVALGQSEGLPPWRVLPFILALIVLIVWRVADFYRLAARLRGA